MAQMGETARLITIPLSHYCEKARWGLELGGVRFREEAHVPGFHVLAVKAAGGRRSTPVLVTAGGVYPDSTDILQYVDRSAPERRLYPVEPGARAEVERLEDRFDEELGPHARRALYYHLLPRPDLTIPMMGAGTPLIEQRLLPFSYPMLRRVMTRALRITPVSAERSRVKVRAIFDEVSARLADGRRFLVGDRFTAADLCFAALAAPCVLARGYPISLPSIVRLPPEAAAIVRELQGTPAGAFVARMYNEHRHIRGERPSSQAWER